MDRAELELMDREGLVLRAQAAGIRRARLLTRPELVDELLRTGPVVDETQLKKTRGFFGLARDLLSRVVERGLHLPDAADRLRAALGSPPFDVPRPEPQAVPTVTLAEIYAAQGHKQRAVETLQRVLEAEPDHGAARALLEKLEASDYVVPLPVLPPEPAEAESPVVEEEEESDFDSESDSDESEYEESDAEPLENEDPRSHGESRAGGARAGLGREPSLDERVAEASGIDDKTREVRAAASPAAECVAIPLGGGRQYVAWHHIGDLESQATFVVRALVLTPTWDGPEQRMVDVRVDPDAGEIVLRDLPPRAIVRVAVGWLAAGAFTPIAHSPALELSESDHGRLARWTPEGSVPLPNDGTIARAAERAMRVSS